ncbi:YdcF family protein [Sphingomonas lacunae]|uniref:YdcF family protein n=1 Tax=Sphingomonas lacunae TaxID=2698828 RepID=A0A6M4ARY8_9SPHN|nr:YdcF family protein [Sphingomonas lacunae]QJQ31848.1 YdcF family protein [Sphingomonas lacunae]
MIRRLISALALIWLLGFVWFSMFLPQPLGDWRTDGIVVFTGGPHRISRALDLLEAGQAKRVLISGVGLDVRPVDLAATYRRPVALFDCCVALGREAVDTRSNGQEVARWVERRGYRSIRLVTTDWHMRRARFELEQSLPAEVVIVSDAVPSRPSFRTLWVEYHKLILRSIGALLGI